MSDRQQILVVDDDVELCRLLAQELEDGGGFSVTSAHAIAEAEEACRARDGAFAAVVLDVGLPDGDGRDFCARLRRSGARMPILMLTGSAAEADVVRGLSSGADDYIAKPFRTAVLMARLRSQLRTFESSVHLTIGIGRFTFQPSERVLHDPGRRRIILTEKETSILRFLCRTPGEAVSRAALLTEVWGYNDRVSTHTVETHIYRLRQKIEAEPGTPRLIRSQPGSYSIHPDEAAPAVA